MSIKYKIELTLEDLGGKTLLREHHVTPLHEIEEMIAKNHPFINLDNGCAFVKKQHKFNIEELGNLCAFNLDTRQLVVQGNIEPPSKPRKKIRFKPQM